MSKELKIRIHDVQETKQKLLALGAKYTGDKTYEYTYFNQPQGKVLKITTKPLGARCSQRRQRLQNTPATARKTRRNPKTLEKEKPPT